MAMPHSSQLAHYPLTTIVYSSILYSHLTLGLAIRTTPLSRVAVSPLCLSILQSEFWPLKVIRRSLCPDLDCSEFLLHIAIGL